MTTATERNSMGDGSDEDVPLEAVDLSVAYGRKMVLWDVDFAVPRGSVTAVVGPNGAGKSTLLKASMGLVPISAGEVRFFGGVFAKARHRVAYVPQRESVDWDFPVSALDVVAMGLYRRIGWFLPVRGTHRERALGALERVGMADYAGRQISELSGGQQQRVFLARALVQDAELYLMDEPFASVDAATERAIVDLLHEIRDRGRTVVCVHHDLQTVRGYFDRVVLLNMRVVAAGPVAEVFDADHLRKTYGNQLAVLSDAVEVLRSEELPR